MALATSEDATAAATTSPSTHCLLGGVVKGLNLLRDIVAEGEARPVTWTAIPCVERAQAEALRIKVGEDERLN